MEKQYTVMIAGIAKSGMEDYVRKNLTKMMEESQQDPGCIIYNIHESIENPGEFMVYMVWQDKNAFKKHNQKPKMQEFKSLLAPTWFEEQSPKTYWQILT